MAETFGALLRRIRERKTVEVRRSHPSWRRDRVVTIPMPINELAGRADLDPAGVLRLEAGKTHPKRETVMKLAAGLELGDVDRDLLLVAAGYCPQAFLQISDTLRRMAVLAIVELARRHPNAAPSDLPSDGAEEPGSKPVTLAPPPAPAGAIGPARLAAAEDSPSSAAAPRRSPFFPSAQLPPHGPRRASR